MRAWVSSTSTTRNCEVPPAPILTKSPTITFAILIERVCELWQACRCLVRWWADDCSRPEETSMADTADHAEVRLVAHCRRCNGWLVSAASVTAGIGPRCATHEAAEQRAATAAQPTALTLFDIAA